MAEILVTDITTGQLTGGTGVFDLLLQSEQIRLDKQYEQNRIRGDNYSKVYLGSLEATMQQSIIFLLGKQEADKKAELIDEQITQVTADVLKSQAETALINQKTETEVFNTLVAEKQVEKMSAEILLVEAQVRKVDKEIEKISKDILVLDEQILIAKQELLIKQKQLEIMEEELILTRAKAWVEIAQVSDDVTIVAPPATITGMIGEQIKKMTAEAILMDLRGVSEKAQTEDIITGVLGKQMTVLIKQAEGFDRDAEQKASKIMSDSFSVQKTADEGVLTPDGLHMDEITKVLDALKIGLGLSPAPDYPDPA